MKKNFSLSKRAKAVIASAMALTLAVPVSVAMKSTAVTNAEEEAYPAPIAVYDFSADETVTMVANGVEPVISKEAVAETDTHENVVQALELKDTRVTPAVMEVITKAGVDASGNACEVTEEVVKVKAKYERSEVQVQNPFKGMDELIEEPSFVTMGSNKIPYWEKGVTISYWQKASAEESTVISFSNSRKNIVHKDDRDKYNIFKMYDENPDNPLFSLGTASPEALEYKAGMKIDGVGVEKATGTPYKKEYLIYKDPGSLVRFNPNYPGQGYILVPEYKKSGKLKGYVLTGIGTPYEKSEFGDISKLRTGTTKGGLQFNSSGAWGYIESAPTEMFKDGYSTGTEESDWKSLTQGNGALAEAYLTVSGQAVFQEPSPVNAPGQWKYVTRVIKPDSISTYIDGKLVDYELYTEWGSTAGRVAVHKGFNLGWGYYTSASEPDMQIVQIMNGNDIYKDGDGISIKTGKTDASSDRLGFNGNTDGMTMIEMLVNENTTLSFGGMSTGIEEEFKRQLQTYAGTALAEVAFFAEPLNQDQITALYEDACAMTEKKEESNPGTGDEPVIPGVSDEPVIPGVSGEPVTPEESQNPVTPGESQNPATPGESKNPATPGESQNPATPGESQNPATPGESKNPATPGESQNPATPGESQNPATPGESKNPATPGESQNPSASGAAVYGDVNGDGVVKLDDAQIVLRKALLLQDLDPAKMILADVNEDGYVKLDDAQQILRKALLLIPDFVKAK